MSDLIAQKVKELCNQIGLLVVATTNTDRPRCRYMTISMEDDLSIWAVTHLSSNKIKDIKANFNVCCLTPIDLKDWSSPHAIIHGTAEILDNPEIKHAYWRKSLRRFFQGPDDLEYLVLKITPTKFEYFPPLSLKSEIYVRST
ncbi:MAG: pyridoxamine 5'-phosphate oxidase family protein [Pseudomonadota bacterium]